LTLFPLFLTSSGALRVRGGKVFTLFLMVREPDSVERVFYSFRHSLYIVVMIAIVTPNRIFHHIYFHLLFSTGEAISPAAIFLYSLAALKFREFLFN
jgi:hypothetical protein